MHLHGKALYAVLCLFFSGLLATGAQEENLYSSVAHIKTIDGRWVKATEDNFLDVVPGAYLSMHQALNSFLSKMPPEQKERALALMSDGGAHASRAVTISEEGKALFEKTIKAYQEIAHTGAAFIGAGGVPVNFCSMLMQLSAGQQHPTLLLRSRMFVHDRFNAGTGFLNKPWGSRLTQEEWGQFDAQRGRFVQLVGRVLGSKRLRDALLSENLKGIVVSDEKLVHIPGRPQALDDRNYVVMAAWIAGLHNGFTKKSYENLEAHEAMGRLTPLGIIWNAGSGNNISSNEAGEIVLTDHEQPNNLNFLHGDPRNKIGGGVLVTLDTPYEFGMSPGERHALNLGFGHGPDEYETFLNQAKDSLGLPESAFTAAMGAFYKGLSISAENYRANGYAQLKEMLSTDRPCNARRLWPSDGQA